MQTGYVLQSSTDNEGDFVILDYAGKPVARGTLVECMIYVGLLPAPPAEDSDESQ